MGECILPFPVFYIKLHILELKMTLLSGILGSSSFQSNAAVTEFDQAEGEQALAGIVNTSNAIDVAHDRLDRLIGAAETISALNPSSTDGIKMARIHLAEAMTACELDADEAIQATAALEDDGANVGLEAWTSVKDFVKSIIDWIKKQWAKLKKFVMKYWHKYFGDVERLKKSWVKVQTEAKAKSTGYTLEKNAKGDFDKSADWFFINDTMQDGDKLVDGLGHYKTFAENYPKVVADLEDVKAEEDDILNSEGLLQDAFKSAPAYINSDSSVKIGLSALKFNKPTSGSSKSVAAIKYAQSASGPLLGRIEMVYCEQQSGTKDLEVIDMIKSMKIYIGEVSKTQKKKPKASMKFVEASTIEDLAENHISLLDDTITLKRSKEIVKVEDNLDKLTKGLDKWKKAAPDKEEGAPKISAFKMAVRIAGEVHAAVRRFGITTPLEFCQQVRTLSGAHLEYAQRSLKAMKKD